MNVEVLNKYCDNTEALEHKSTIINKFFVYNVVVCNIIITIIGIYAAYSMGLCGLSPFRANSGLAIVGYIEVYILVGLLWFILIGVSFIAGSLFKYIKSWQMINKKDSITLLVITGILPLLFPIVVNPYVCNLGQKQYDAKQREIEHETYNRNKLYKNSPIQVEEYYVEKVTPNGIEKSERRHPNSRK